MGTSVMQSLTRIHVIACCILPVAFQLEDRGFSRLLLALVAVAHSYMCWLQFPPDWDWMKSGKGACHDMSLDLAHIDFVTWFRFSIKYSRTTAV